MTRFAEALQSGFDRYVDEPMWAEYALPYAKLIVKAAMEPEKRQKGWMTRIHPNQFKFRPNIVTIILRRL